MRILITGGAGFIGSQIAWTLHDWGYQPVIIDNLSTGSANVIGGLPLYRADIADSACLDAIMRDFPDIRTVIHCAASTVVRESAGLSLHYYKNNVGQTIEMLRCLRGHPIKALIFSSSAAVYSETSGKVDEDAAVSAASPFAGSKLFLERILDDVARTTGVWVLALRYFNPIGADIEGRCGRIGLATDLLSSLIRCSRQRVAFPLRTSQRSSSDGTPVRDFVDVVDIARAHATAIEAVSTMPQDHFRNQAGLPVLNIGSGRATTVREFVETYRSVADPSLRITSAEPRPGSARGNAADISKARRLLNWAPMETIEDSIRLSVEWVAYWGRTAVPTDFAASNYADRSL